MDVRYPVKGLYVWYPPTGSASGSVRMGYSGT